MPRAFKRAALRMGEANREYPPRAPLLPAQYGKMNSTSNSPRQTLGRNSSFTEEMVIEARSLQMLWQWDMRQDSSSRARKMPSNGLNFLPKACYFLIPVQFLQQVPSPWASLGTTGLCFNFSGLTLLSQISVTADFKREHTWFIRLLNDIHCGTDLKALNAFKFFFFFFLNNKYNLAVRMDLPTIGKDLHHRRKQAHLKDSLPYSTFTWIMIMHHPEPCIKIFCTIFEQHLYFFQLKIMKQINLWHRLLWKQISNVATDAKDKSGWEE